MVYLWDPSAFSLRMTEGVVHFPYIPLSIYFHCHVERMRNILWWLVLCGILQSLTLLSRSASLAKSYRFGVRDIWPTCQPTVMFNDLTPFLKKMDGRSDIRLFKWQACPASGGHLSKSDWADAKHPTGLIICGILRLSASRMTGVGCGFCEILRSHSFPLGWQCQRRDTFTYVIP